MGAPAFELFFAEKLVDVGKPAQAEEHIARVRKLGLIASTGGHYLRLANVIECKMHLKNDKPEKALSRVNSFIVEDGEQNDYIFMRAKIFLALDDKVRAKADLEKLIAAGYEPAKELYKGL